MRSTESDVLLRLADARLGHAGRAVLEGVDLEIREGEFWFLLGPNGAGKTTLLRTLLGLVPLLGGHLERDPRRAARSRTGFVPQQCSFSPALPTTVREFVSLGAIGSDRPAQARAADLAWALERSGLGGFVDRDYWSLSGGQRRRALVARALVRRPGLLLVDEPTEGMDIGSQEAFLATLEALHREEGSTLLFVTHHIEIAARHATHVALAHAGHVDSGLRDDVLRSSHLARVFGDPGDAVSRALGEMRKIGERA